MNPADLGLAAGDLPRFLAGMALFLLPGLAAADRLVPGRTRFILAPVFSFTLLPVAAILLNFAFGWRATPGSTALLAVAMTLAFASNRLERMLRPDRRPPEAGSVVALAGGQEPAANFPGARRLRLGLEVLAVVAIAALAGFTHALPHFPGPDASLATAYPTLASRVESGASGDTYPYPVHVDEHAHLAKAAYVARNGSLADPYTGERYDGGLFSLRGLVHERGFQVGLAQVAMLSGASLPLVFLWGASLWAAFLAVLVWGLARPNPGAIAGAALVAALPTDVTFMGASFLVPIAFGLAWIVALAWVVLRSSGARRVAGILILVTGAFFIHFMAGIACLVVAICASLARDASWRSRLGVALVAFVPFVWLGPGIAEEVAQEAAGTYSHAVGRFFFNSVGWPFWILFVAGAGAALAMRSSPVHRAMAGLGSVVALFIAVSIVTGNDDLALYYRSSHVLFLAAAVLAGHAAGLLGRGTLRFGLPTWSPGAVTLVVAAIALAPGIASHLSEPYYRVHDDASWESGRALINAGAGPGDVFLSEPWRAMLYNGLTGATPYTVLHPGTPAPRADWDFYLNSNGASEAWLKQRHIGFVVAPIPPNAPHVDLGAGAYQLT